MSSDDNLTKLSVVFLTAFFKLHVFALLSVDMASLPYLTNQLSQNCHQSTETFPPSSRM